MWKKSMGLNNFRMHFIYPLECLTGERSLGDPLPPIIPPAESPPMPFSHRPGWTRLNWPIHSMTLLEIHVTLDWYTPQAPGIPWHGCDGAKRRGGREGWERMREREGAEGKEL